MELVKKVQKVSASQDQNGFKGRIEASVQQMYNEDDLSSCSLFGGGFINFGYWDGLVKTDTISADERIESQKNMYRYVLSKLNISNDDRILEVASGLGVGSSLALKEFNPREITGIDFAEAQIQRAKKINHENIKTGRLSYQQGAAESIPFENQCFNKLYSIEAAQHFASLDKFVNESHRVLKSNGKIAIASFFGTSEDSLSEMSALVQTVRDGLDHLTPIEKVRKLFLEAGFKNLKVESIGLNVWEKFDKWVSQGDLKDSWTRNWLKGYQQNHLDYYLISAEKD